MNTTAYKLLSLNLTIGFMSLFWLSNGFSDELPPIIVESSVFENQTTEDFAQPAAVLHGEELERKRSSSIGETLNNELGVSSTYFGPGASRPIIRGLGANRVRVLENGIDSLDVSSASEDHAVSIEPYTAEQIEIIRGPATLRYGPGAVGGVVNVINKRLPQSLADSSFEVDLDLDHATVSDGNTAAIDLNGTIDSFTWHFDGLKRDTNDYEIDGFADESEPEDEGRLNNSDVETDSYGIGGSLITDKGMLGLAFSRFDTDYGVAGAEEGDIRIDLKQYRYEGQAKLFNPFSMVDSISLRATYNNYRHFEIEPSGEIATTFDNEELESRLELVTSYSDSWKNAFGIQYNDREFSAQGEEAFIEPEIDEERYGFFAITNFKNELWNVELGARFDSTEFDPDIGDEEDFSTHSLSLGVIRELANDMHINFVVTNAERAPQEAALFADGPHLATLTFERGDNSLDEESWLNFEIGLGQDKPNYSWHVNAYYNYVDDYIFLASVDENDDGIADRVDEEGVFEFDGELLLGDYVNEDAEFYGIEAELKGRIYESNQLAIDGRVFGDFVRAKFRDGDEGDVPRIPPARIGFGANVEHGQWDGSLDLIFVTEQKDTADLETDTDSYTMLNASVSRTIYVGDTDVKLFLKGKNLLDEDARRHSSFQKDRVPLPGRGAVFGLAIDY